MNPAVGETVAVFDERARRWRVAAVLAIKPDRVIVATREWWGAVLAPKVRRVRVVGAAA